MINDPVVTTDFETGELIFDGLAESIEPNEDQTVWTVTLKEGRTFQNGEPVDAEAFERAWAYDRRPEERRWRPRASCPAIDGAGEGKTLSGFKVVDDQTFEVTLSGPFSQFGQLMSYAPAFVPDRPGVPRRPQGLQRGAHRHRSLHDGRRLEPQQEHRRHQVGRLRG